MDKLTYKDFKIGQFVTCVKVDDFFEDHITFGKQYEIVDLDYHFPNKICISGNITSLFIKIDYFIDTLQLRKIKIDKIRNNS